MSVFKNNAFCHKAVNLHICWFSKNFFIFIYPIRSMMLFKSIFVAVKQSNDSTKQGQQKKPDKKGSTEPSHDMQVLLLQIESLQSQLEEQTKLAKQHEEALLEDRRVRMEEQTAQHQRDSDKIKALTEYLHKTQTLLYESTKDFLELKYEGRRKERRWMMERDKIMQELDYIKEQMEITRNEDIEVI